ncbi:hypothetical protein SPRG_16520 [Saprolegnia parasitica CBS 223.65]|uniref:Uncharacterized protein n=1 Tax=Saprolegnia parasitica (strain CBS 223.65) TaxID=695850 RepID=A0A067BMY1_SAPPC|nr:hypothetical protein SPRG_16520 [Saprolegnia parasitica CBS 223.65]KDO18105.1 hypothetical protein SPRG_16520 [Saprolegnia parasitica CBS 223.65]|eukprot:XP_012211186.1 hypothetical protein SPRG_16520 [Saprolegnia parasitica CBS 223.65]
MSSRSSWTDLVKVWIQLGQCLRASVATAPAGTSDEAYVVKKPTPPPRPASPPRPTQSTLPRCQVLTRKGSPPSFHSLLDRFLQRPKSPIRLPRAFLNRTVLTVAGKRVPFTRCMSKVARSQIKPLPTIVEMYTRH